MTEIIYFALGVFVGIVGTMVTVVLSFDHYKKKKGDKHGIIH